nr:MAG: ORF1 [TTV-like mini virus]
MPWPWRRPYYRRRRLTWRRRPRRFVHRRLWRRRKRRYRPRVRRKLRFLRLKEWQPLYIRKLKIITTIPGYMTTAKRIDHNMRLFEDNISPHYVPSLGGFSITTFSLNSLYQLFLKGRAWWTQSNDVMPLIRYTGCTITLWRSESSDYIVKYFNCYPMSVSMASYNSSQPSFMQLSKNHRIIRCKKWNNIKKPYTKIRVKPPSPMQNKWFFQKSLADTPLLMLFITSMSLDRYYLHSNAQSNTIGFKGLNTQLIQYHDFLRPGTTGYRFKPQLYLWTFQQGTTPPPTIDNIEVGNLIYLGNAQKLQPGETLNDMNKYPDAPTFDKQKTKYLSSPEYWGNPFIKAYFNPDPKSKVQLLFTTEQPVVVLRNYTENKQKLKQGTTNPFRYFVEPLFKEYRYNPFPDEGRLNEIYLVDLKEIQNTWDPPQDDSLTNNNLPLWLGLWGFSDWQKLNNVPIDTEKLIVLKTPHIWPQDKIIVPIDDDFLNGNSPFRPPNNVTPSDRLQWHPKACFQYQSVTNICSTGPATIKLPPNVSAENHITLKFHFKLGGCVQPVKNIEKPSDQPDFPLPNNKFSSTSLQSPETPFETFLYSFDWRRHFLTQKATQRISEHSSTEMPAFPSTGINLLNAAPTPTASKRTTETSEEEEEALQQLLNLLKQRQDTYKQRILQLVGNFE